MTLTERILSPLPGNVLARLRQADQMWHNLRGGNHEIPEVITESKESLSCEWDVIISGGTLGILLATVLQKQGWQVALLERGFLRGRDQEWNISRQELTVFLELDLLTTAELEQAIVTEYERGRVSFYQGCELWVTEVLNIGIDPVFLLETLKQKFLAAGGQLLEQTPFQSATAHPNGVAVTAGHTQLSTRLLIDAMGHFSPIVRQARAGAKPEGVCLVVGSCAQGYSKNETGDLITSFTPIRHQCQYFWEAFPARDGRTTYLFTYLDAHPQRPNLEFFMEEYLGLLPEYQNIALSQLQFQRFLFGFFPSYRRMPVRMPWPRILPAGDSSGNQSPVSFGGFGAMVRHLKRLSLGVQEALETDTLGREALHLLQPYQPNISVTWLFQRTMSVDVERSVPPNQINQLMSEVFTVMNRLGDDVLKPFLQDVVQFSALSKTLPLVDPKLVLPIVAQVGIAPLVDWSIHYVNLAIYSGLYPLGKAILPLCQDLPARQQYYYHRWLEAWKYGSGGDYGKPDHSIEQ
ncbi:MAG: FAD-dependent oxidoreductase [Cyanophyceae cyanobacterium]